ncbi:MAG: Txe/YoeB family addiction module toxin [Rhizomicrobium sp.]
MNIVWSSVAWNDYCDWHDREPRVAEKINNLIVDIRRSPFSGIGRPEPLKANLSGWWARRITGEHRLVYRVVGKRGQDQRLEILQCRFHY